MKSWTWGLLSGLSALAVGCEQAVEPAVKADPANPTSVVSAESGLETATFALG